MSARSGVRHGEERRFEGRSMGSPLRVAVVRARAKQAEGAWQRIRAEMDATEAELTRFRADSALSAMNARAGSGAWQAAGPRLYAMGAISARAWHVTEGRFDARVLRRLEALGERAGVPLPPEAADEPTAPAAPAAACGIERDPWARRLRIGDPLDSGGVGKGLGLRWAHRSARERLDDPAGLLVEAGGDIVVSGSGPDGGPWKIGVEDPAGGEPMAVVALGSGAIATSSIAVRRWAGPDGLPVHHLIDPRSGEPGGDGLRAVTVAFGDPAWAEIWSKALFLAGAGTIGPLARSRGLAAWWVHDDGHLEMTPAGRALTAWERPLVRRSA